MSNKQALQKSIDRAKIKLLMLKNSVFISTVLFSLKLKWTEDVPTAAVDGKTLFINPDFWLGLTTKTQIFVLAHESWHVAFNHMFRCKAGNYNKKKHNYAADYVINIMLKDAGYEVSGQWLCDAK